VEVRPKEKLSELTVATLERVVVGVDNRLFKPKFGPEAWKSDAGERSLLFDAILYLHPACRTLWHVRDLVTLFGGQYGEKSEGTDMELQLSSTLYAWILPPCTWHVLQRTHCLLHM
jgi:hypothetical protein